MNVKSYRFPSATGVCEITTNVYTPEDGVFDTVMVIHHGMAEHQERYLGFIDFLCRNGVAVYMHDMANHGKSNTDYELAGWFGEKDGWKGLIQDFRRNVQFAKDENPDKKLIVMGHSMGSFICRCYTSMYPQDGFAGAIYMGTGGPNPIAGMGLATASMMGKLQGKRHKSKTLDKMTFGSYNKKFEGRTGFDWLTRDPAIVDKYIADPYCGFLFTIQGMHDLVELNVAANAESWYAGIPADAKILLISGAMDPVGEYGKGIHTIDDKLRETGHTNVTLKLYPDCRHEVLNELNRAEIMDDILAWIREV